MALLVRLTDTTGAYHTGASPDCRTMSVLKDNDITSYRHKARKVRVPQDFEEFDYVLAMDDENLHDLRDSAMRAIKKGSLDESVLSKIQLFGTFGGKAKSEEIGDPYYGGRDGFEIAYEQVSRFGEGLLKHIEEEAAGSSKI
ncbi:hypothetical protein AMS68_005520 [Peltaster fructicola]|uniref:Phosphotyrosine protein phosphatase I domain-containing protein n=1 Tax=Peltaster fructicola TaxID=286661 RepID=A0A6H0XZ18_9PEZI|nr:hypothetical protein AMS68_005520 [Peltaster fructicola]